jgi:hypothetical protein
VLVHLLAALLAVHLLAAHLLGISELFLI